MLPLRYVAYQHFICFFEVGLHVIGVDIAKGGGAEPPSPEQKGIIWGTVHYQRYSQLA